MLKFTEQSKTPGITLNKTWLSLKGISCFYAIFQLIWMKQMLICLNLQRDETVIDSLTSRIPLQKVCCYKMSVCTKVCMKLNLEGWSLTSQVNMIAGQNIEKKYLMCQMPIKMLKQHAIPNSSLHNLKIYSSKECRKTIQT